MIVAELISINQILPKFHKIAEQVTGTNSASHLQKSKRPRSQDAYILSYFSIFNHPDSDPSDVKALRGLLHVGMVCAGYPEDMEQILTTPHGLKTLSGFQSGRGAVGYLFAGDMGEWSGAIQLASQARFEAAAREWAAACYTQFAKHDLSGLLDVNPPKKVDGYLTY